MLRSLMTQTMDTLPLSPDAALVLDTNTVLALWMFQDPGLTLLRARIEAGCWRLASRSDALEELALVLAYRQFGLEEARRADLLARYAARVQHAPAQAADAAPLPKCRDRDDQKFLEIARDAGAAVLVTRDKALLRLARHRLVRDLFAIMTPEKLGTLIEPE